MPLNPLEIALQKRDAEIQRLNEVRDTDFSNTLQAILDDLKDPLEKEILTALQEGYRAIGIIFGKDADEEDLDDCPATLKELQTRLTDAFDFELMSLAGEVCDKWCEKHYPDALTINITATRITPKTEKKKGKSKKYYEILFKWREPEY